MTLIGNILFDSTLWFCASGNSFFFGVVLLIITAVIHTKLHRKRFLAGIWFLYIISIAAILLASTPLPPLFYCFWVIAFITYQIIRKKYPTPALAVLIIVSTAAILMELPWHFPRKIVIDSFEQIYIIGDSVSAGMGNDEERTWTVLLSEELQTPVINLAVAGATASSALKKQVPQVIGQNNLVFLEIGGNDLLNFNSPEEYKKDLTEIILRLNASSNKIVWFKLPLLPQYYRYGRIQRTLAKQYNISLIPKSALTTVFCTKGATSDGIHLTPRGHEIMEQQIRQLLE